MSFELEFSELAAEQIQEIRVEDRNAVVMELTKLKQAPRVFRRPSRPPREPAGYQSHRFSIRGTHRSYVILFHYMQDESRLWVYAIGHDDGSLGRMSYL